MKHFLLVATTLLIGIKSFALMGELEDERPKYHYFLEPLAGYHLGSSELPGTTTLDQGPMVGLRFKIERENYFFAPDAELIEVVGLDKSPATMWSLGLIAGAKITAINLDVYAGMTYREFNNYKVDGMVSGRVGAAWGIGGSDLQIFVEGMFGQFTQTTFTQQIDYTYITFEGGIQFPFEL